MKKLIVCITVLALSAPIMASTPAEKAAQEKENMRLLAQMGMPIPGSGIKLVPRSMLDLTPADIAKGEREAAEFKEKGYVSTYTNRPNELLTIKDSLDKELRLASRAPRSDLSTGLYKNVREIKLGFMMPGNAKGRTLRDASPDINIIAATPYGGFHEDKGGWSGVAQFFEYKGIGTCSYSIKNVKASHGATELAQEDVTYTINNKATILLPVEGSNSSGFLYQLRWYDDVNFHELECANRHYSRQINDSVIALAKQIDKGLR